MAEANVTNFKIKSNTKILEGYGDANNVYHFKGATVQFDENLLVAGKKSQPSKNKPN